MASTLEDDVGGGAMALTASGDESWKLPQLSAFGQSQLMLNDRNWGALPTFCFPRSNRQVLISCGTHCCKPERPGLDRKRSKASGTKKCSSRLIRGPSGCPATGHLSEHESLPCHVWLVPVPRDLRPYSAADPDKSFSNLVKAVSMVKKTLSLSSGLWRVR